MSDPELNQPVRDLVKKILDKHNLQSVTLTQPQKSPDNFQSTKEALDFLALHLNGASKNVISSFNKIKNFFLGIDTVKKTIPVPQPTVTGQKPVTKVDKPKQTTSTVDEIVFKLIPREVKGSRRWLRKAVELNPDQAKTDFGNGKLTAATVNNWLALYSPTKNNQSPDQLVIDINKQWSDFKSKHKDVQVYQNPSSAVEKQALDLRKTLAQKAKNLPPSAKAKLSLPKVRQRSTAQQKGNKLSGKGKSSAGPKGSFGGLSDFLALIKELRAAFV